MNDRQKQIQGSGMTPGNIYYVLFRHKWKIISCAAVGVLAAVVLPIVHPALYQSEAKLLIRYVTDSKSLNPSPTDSKVKSPDERGDNIINSEIEILTSLDLAQQVVDTLGAEKILAKAGGGKDRNKAASFVRRNLIVEVPRKSSVIRLVYQHPDPDVVQIVLREVIDSYFKKHAEIHRAVGVFDDFLTQETDQLRSRLAQTEQELRKAKNKAGVISLDDTKKGYAEQISKIRQDLFAAEAELAERQAALKEIGKLPPTATAATTPVGAETPSGKVDEYKSLCARLDLLWKKEQELLTQFTTENTRVKEIREQIVLAEQLKKKFEAEHPNLVSLVLPTSKSAGQPANTSADVSAELARIPALDAKIKFLNSELDQIRTEAASVDEMEGSIVELQRKKELDEGNYKYFSASLEQSRIDEQLAAREISNISRIQAPSPPFRDLSQTFKMRALAIIGGVLLGLAWAFSIELYLDHSVKRPTEIESKLRLPLFLSVPDFTRNGYHHCNGASHHKNGNGANGNGHALPAAGNGTNGGAGGSEMLAWAPRHSLRPFHEALRDRLVMYFDAQKMTHRPKLVAVTAPDRGLGVTTMAVGLAACLSQTGDGKVLLVDLTQEQGAVKQFFNGELDYGLDAALGIETRACSQVQDNLYVVAGTTNGDGRLKVLPKKFSDLVVKLNTSNYDYIIFDMPPITQTSVTPRLAHFMDLVLLVLESEKTDRDVALQASALLAGPKANVCVVLNKTRMYVPSPLRHELLNDI